MRHSSLTLFAETLCLSKSNNFTTLHKKAALWELPCLSVFGQADKRLCSRVVVLGIVVLPETKRAPANWAHRGSYWFGIMPSLESLLIRAFRLYRACSVTSELLEANIIIKPTSSVPIGPAAANLFGWKPLSHPKPGGGPLTASIRDAENSTEDWDQYEAQKDRALAQLTSVHQTQTVHFQEVSGTRTPLPSLTLSG